MKKLFSILLVISMIFSLVPANLLTVTATDGSNENGVDTWSLTLKDDISVNFKMNIGADVAQDANAKVTATVGGDSYSWSASHAATNIINVPVCAAQMTDTITVSVISGNGNILYSNDYSARQYADYILENSYSASTKSLVEAMLHYGGAAQTYFEYNTNNLANEGITSTVLVPENDAKPIVKEGNITGVKFYGSSLMMRNKISIRYYFILADGTEPVFTCNGEELTPVAKDGMHYVEVLVNSPALYCEDLVVTATSGDQSMSVTYSVERYIKRVYHKADATLAAKAMTSGMYNYCKAAENFQACPSVEVSYDLNGVIGTTPATAILDSGENYGALPVVDAGNELISFGGWYLDAACSADKAVTENTTVGTENHTLYAKWNVEGYKADEVGCDLTVAAFNGENAIKFTNTTGAMPKYWKDLKAGQTVKIKVSFDLPGFSGTAAEPQSWVFFYQMNANGANIGEHSTGIRACVANDVVKTGDGWTYSPENYAGPQTVTLELAIQQDCSGLVSLLHAPAGAEVYIHSIEVFDYDVSSANLTLENTTFNGESAVKFTSSNKPVSGNTRYWKNLKAGQTVQIKVSFDLPGFSGTTAEPQSWLFAYQMDANGNNIGEHTTGIRACLADGVVKTGDGWSYSPENYAGPQTVTLELPIQQDCSGLVMLLYAPVGAEVYIHSIDVLDYDVSNANLAMEKTTFNGESAVKFTSSNKPVTGHPRYWKNLKAGETVKVTVSFNLPGFSGTTAEPQSWLFLYQMDANGYNIGEYSTGIRACLVDGEVKTGDGWSYSPENYAGPQTVTLELPIQQDCSGLMMLMYAPSGTEVYIHSIEVIEPDPILANYEYIGSANNLEAVELNGEKLVKVTNRVNGSGMPKYWMNLKAGQTVQLKLSFDMPGFSGTTAEPQSWLFAYQMDANGSNIGEYSTGIRACMVDGVVKTGDGWTYSPENYAGPQTVTLELPIQQDCSGLVFLAHAPEGTTIYIHSITVKDPRTVVNYDLNGLVGEVPASTSLNPDDTYGQLPVPNANSNLVAFDGWYLDAACSADKAVTASTIVGAQDHTLYAKWNILGYKSYEVGCDLSVASINGANGIKFTNTTGVMPKYWMNLKAGQTVKIKVSFDLPGFSGTAAEPQSWVFFYQMDADGNNIGEHSTGIRACVADDVVKTGDGWTYSPENYAGPQTVTLELAIQQDCSGLVSLLHAPAGAEVYIHSIEVFDYDVSSANLDLEYATFNGESAVKFTIGNKPVSGNARYWKNLKAGQTVQMKVSFNLPGFSGTTAEPQSWVFFYQMDANGYNIGEYSTGVRACLADGVVKTGDGWSYSPANYSGPQTVVLELPIQQDCSGLVMLLYAPAGAEVYIHSIEVVGYDVSNANLNAEYTTFNGESAVKFTSSNKPVTGHPRLWKELKAGQTVRMKVSFNLPGFSGTTAEPQSWLFAYQMDANGNNIGEYCTGTRACLVDGVVKTGDGWSYSPENYAGPQTVTLELKIQQDCSGLMMLLHAPAGAEVYIHSIDVVENFAIPTYEDNVSMAIGAWMAGEIGIAGMKPEYFSYMKNANMNVAIGTPVINVEQYLDEASANGVKVLVDERNWDGTVPSYVNHEAFLGMCVYDEPKYSYISTLASQKAQWDASGLRDDMYFVNTYPSYASADWLGQKWYDFGNIVTTYDRYIRDYIAKVQPEVLSMDHYAILPVEGTKIIRENWFADMDICAHYAKEAGIPFWYTLLAAGHENVYETATVEELRWQMAVGQAYGAQGLMHFMFGPQGENCLAMLDASLTTPTYLYYRVVEANAEIAKWDHIYMNYEWLGTDTILGTNNSSNSAFDLCKYTKDVTKNSCITAISSNEDLLCGMFKDANNNQGFMVVNATNPAEGKNATVNITLEEGYTGALIIQKGEQNIIHLDGNSAQITVPSSEGIFIIPLV